MLGCICGQGSICNRSESPRWLFFITELSHFTDDTYLGGQSKLDHNNLSQDISSNAALNEETPNDKLNKPHPLHTSDVTVAY
jgi:hypothetical protein